MRRRLDAELVRRGLARSRADATAAVREQRVLVGGAVAANVARLVADDEPLQVRAPRDAYVSRGGHKLAAALDAFAVAVAGRRWLDAGASAGGFTDCLLQRGAGAVVAVDVGRGQLAWSLREDPRVEVRERTNVRWLWPDDIGGAVDAVCADLSFISLLTVAAALLRCAATDADFVLLVKPQFEAGRARVGRGGVVRDAGIHRAVLSEVVDGLAAEGLGVRAVIRSPLTGADGNHEFLAHARPGPRAVTDRRLEVVTAAAGEPGQNGP